MKKQLIAGKRYTWPTSNMRGARWVNGLFTGEYDKTNGNAILMTRDGERWNVPIDICQEMPKR